MGVVKLGLSFCLIQFGARAHEAPQPTVAVIRNATLKAISFLG